MGESDLDFAALKPRLEIEQLMADIAKAKAAAVKSALEADELRKPWYVKPAILQPLAAISVAVVAAIVGYSNGWFQTKLESFKIEQTKLLWRWLS